MYVCIFAKTSMTYFKNSNKYVKKKIPITNCYSHFCAMNSATSDLYAWYAITNWFCGNEGERLTVKI